MTWTYSADPTSDRDKVRFLCGDVDSTDPLATDADVALALSMYGDVVNSAAAVCRLLAGRYSRQADIAMDALKKSLSQVSASFAKRAGELEEQAASPTGIIAIPTIYAGGISIADKDNQVLDEDRVRPFFTRHSMEPSGVPYYDGLHETSDTSTVRTDEE